MYARLLLALLCLSPATGFAADIGNYMLQSVPHADIDQYLPLGNDSTGTPDNLQGLWWMDGNPLADEVVSFASATFVPVYGENGEVSYATTLAVYDEGVWTWHDSPAGRLLYDVVNRTKLTYYGVFNADFTFGQVTPIITPLPEGAPVALPPSMIVDFTMTKVAPDEWSRDSILLGKKYTYRFRRIVDGQGRHLPAWDDYIAYIGKNALENAIVPFCMIQSTVKTYPTACVEP